MEHGSQRKTKKTKKKTRQGDKQTSVFGTQQQGSTARLVHARGSAARAHFRLLVLAGTRTPALIKALGG